LWQSDIPGHKNDIKKIMVILVIEIHLLNILLLWQLFLVNHYLQCIVCMYVGFTIAMHVFILSWHSFYVFAAYIDDVIVSLCMICVLTSYIVTKLCLDL